MRGEYELDLVLEASLEWRNEWSHNLREHAGKEMSLVLGFLWMARTPSWITLISLTFALTSAEGPGVLSAVAMVFALTIGNGPGVQSASPSRPEEKCTETVAKPAVSTPRSG